MGIANKVDTSRWTCARWEVILGNCLRAASRAAYKECEEWVRKFCGVAIIQ